MRIREYAAESDLRISEVKVESVNSRGGYEFSLLPAKDAAGLYRCAHRSRTAVMAVCGAKVRLDVSVPPTNAGCVSLEQFVRYKCSFSLVTRPAEVKNAFASALTWLEDVNCEGPRDPRCLPLAVFKTGRLPELDDRNDRRAFLREYRSVRSSDGLTDADARVWGVGAPHTRDLLHVGGQVLPIGFHWDVQATRDTIIATGWDRWKLRRGGYVNIHPDALVRGGSAVRTDDACRSAPAERPESAPRSKGRRRGN